MVRTAGICSFVKKHHRRSLARALPLHMQVQHASAPKTEVKTSSRAGEYETRRLIPPRLDLGKPRANTAHLILQVRVRGLCTKCCPFFFMRLETGAAWCG